MNSSENEPPQSSDALNQLQKLVNDAKATAASKVEAWQKVHVFLQDASSLLQSFSVDQKAIGGNEAALLIQSQFSQVAATTFVPIAQQLKDQEDPHSSRATAKILLSSIQTSLSSNLAESDIPAWFQTTKDLLQSAAYPIQGAIERLRPMISSFSPLLSIRLESLAADLQNSTNPLNLSNAATHARELFTFLARELQSDDALKHWLDVELDDNGYPTRRTRLEYYIYSGLPKSALPEKWINTAGIQISELLNGFKELNKLTHLNDKTVSALLTARLKIGEFIDHLVMCLQAREDTISLIADSLLEPARERLQEIAENDLQGELESGVSHAYGPEVWVDQIEVADVDDLCVRFSGSGSISCTFQIGSDGDVRRDEGLEWEGSRGLSFEGEAMLSPTNRLQSFEEVTIEPEDCELDELEYDDLEDDSEE